MKKQINDLKRCLAHQERFAKRIEYAIDSLEEKEGKRDEPDTMFGSYSDKELRRAFRKFAKTCESENDAAFIVQYLFLGAHLCKLIDIDIINYGFKLEDEDEEDILESISFDYGHATEGRIRFSSSAQSSLREILDIEFSILDKTSKK